MDKIVVMYTVDRNNPKGTWSGTSYALKEALKEKVEVIEVDLHEGLLLKGLRIIGDKFSRNKSSYLFGPLHDSLLQLKANFILNKYRHLPVLEIANEVKIKNRYFLYQDLAIAVLPPIQESLKKDLKKSSGGLLLECSDDELQRKIEVQKKIYNSADKIFFMGNWVADRMKELYPQMSCKFVAVGAGINPEFSAPIKSEILHKENIISFIGIDFDRKAGDLVLEAFKILVEKYDTDAQLYIAGPNCIKTDLTNVNFIGKTEREELEQLLKRSTVFCMPSKFEAYGLVFLEAKSYGLLCIGRNNYEMPYLLSADDEDYLIENDDAENLAKNMFILLNDKQKQLRAINNAGKVYSSNTWESVAEKILNEMSL
ncbi:glycosyltransferase family 4 protein [Trichococcus pasteurii]|uniref:Glycosyl transferases group 1 n=1 Tax=Trichococcus pasteurii TaxID=43064 RepID=A0A1W1II96_9LACT|nr:glycosyltransferase family 4 protein [Trichococcus pasteurii]SFF09123.1 Glycosyltransferase involved in cell wall bisynthesis [Trichococcus pasteurii]SLM52744.1 glycosyl transferases group 1 [Trichococcus pasteurii]SSB93625.1 glycosyl transferases group 1 [Trichococcus pasteurii]